MVDAYGSGFEPGCTLMFVYGPAVFPYSKATTFVSSEHVIFEMNNVGMGVAPVRVQNVADGPMSNARLFEVVAEPVVVISTDPTSIGTDPEVFTIHGSGFDSGFHEVTVGGGVALEVIYVDSLPLTVTAPFGFAGDAAVVVRGPNGSSNSDVTIERVQSVPTATGQSTRKRRTT